MFVYNAGGKDQQVRMPSLMSYDIKALQPSIFFHTFLLDIICIASASAFGFTEGAELEFILLTSR